MPGRSLVQLPSHSLGQEFLDNGQLQATTKHGTALFDLRTMPKFRIKPSTDGRYHACIVKSSLTPQPKGRCIYLPAGI